MHWLGMGIKHTNYICVCHRRQLSPARQGIDGFLTNSPNVEYVCYATGKENDGGLWLFNIEYYFSFQMMIPLRKKGMDESMSIHITLDEKEILSINGGFTI